MRLVICVTIAEMTNLIEGYAITFFFLILLGTGERHMIEVLRCGELPG